jgi:hypothetical protein
MVLLGLPHSVRCGTLAQIFAQPLLLAFEPALPLPFA